MSTFSLLTHPVICKTVKQQDVGKDFYTYLFPGSNPLKAFADHFLPYILSPFTFSFISIVLHEAR